MLQREGGDYRPFFGRASIRPQIDPQVDQNRPPTNPKIDFLALSFCKPINLFVVHHHAHRFKSIYSMSFILSVVRRRDHQLESFLLHPVRLSCRPSLRTSQSFGSDFISMHFAQRPLPSQCSKQCSMLCSMPCPLLAIVRITFAVFTRGPPVFAKRFE